MTSRNSLHLLALRLLLILALASAAACTNTPTKRGLPWWPQAPGNVPETEQTLPKKNEQPTTAQPTRTPDASSVQAQPVAAAAPAGAEPASASTSAAGTASRAALRSDAQASRYGDLLFISGQVADAHNSSPAGTVEQQTHAVMGKIGAILDSHRLTMANIVQVTVYLANINDVNDVDAVYQSHFRGNLPARTVVEVARLPHGALVEISAVAGR